MVEVYICRYDQVEKGVVISGDKITRPLYVYASNGCEQLFETDSGYVWKPCERDGFWYIAIPNHALKLKEDLYFSVLIRKTPPFYLKTIQGSNIAYNGNLVTIQDANIRYDGVLKTYQQSNINYEGNLKTYQQSNINYEGNLKTLQHANIRYDGVLSTTQPLIQANFDGNLLTKQGPFVYEATLRTIQGGIADYSGNVLTLQDADIKYNGEIKTLQGSNLSYEGNLQTTQDADIKYNGTFKTLQDTTIEGYNGEIKTLQDAVVEKYSGEISTLQVKLSSYTGNLKTIQHDDQEEIEQKLLIEENSFTFTMQTRQWADELDDFYACVLLPDTSYNIHVKGTRFEYLGNYNINIDGYSMRWIKREMLYTSFSGNNPKFITPYPVNHWLNRGFYYRTEDGEIQFYLARYPHVYRLSNSTANPKYHDIKE